MAKDFKQRQILKWTMMMAAVGLVGIVSIALEPIWALHRSVKVITKAGGNFTQWESVVFNVKTGNDLKQPMWAVPTSLTFPRVPNDPESLRPYLKDCYSVKSVMIFDPRDHVAKSLIDCVADMPNIEELDLNGVNAAAGAFAPIARLTRLKRLYLDRTNIDDDSIVFVTKLPKLELLSATQTGLTNRALANIASSSSLRELDVMGTKCDEMGVREASLVNPSIDIKWGD